MADKIAELKIADGQVEVEIVIGQIQRGDFEIVLYDKNGLNPLLVGRGRNGRAVAYKYVIERPIDELDDSTIIWDVIIGASTTNQQSWSVTLHIRQKGQIVRGGTITNRGEFEVITQMSDEVRLNLK